MNDVVIIGGGVSGIFAAISLKTHYPDAKVILVERLERIGKKILATGNGRCNYSNVNLDHHKYNNPSFVATALKNFNSETTISELEKWGLVSHVDSKGRVYPYSDTATSFLDILRLQLKKLGVDVRCNFDVKKIIYKNDVYEIENTRSLKITANYIVMATGGKATPILGSNGSGFQLLKSLKIKITNLLPGLVGIKVDPAIIKGLAGLRIKTHVSLVDKRAKQKVWEEDGEVQFREDGISGIVIMQAASMIARSQITKKNINYTIEMDLFPNLNEDILLANLMKRKEQFANCENGDFFIGMFQKMLAYSILRQCKIDLAGYVNNLTTKDLIKMVNVIKEYSLDVKGIYDFEKAQVTIGGVDTDEVDHKSMQSKILDTLYFCGEILNIDGECGGYNIQWAISSGNLVGKHLAERILKSEQKDQ